MRDRRRWARTGAPGGWLRAAPLAALALLALLAALALGIATVPAASAHGASPASAAAPAHALLLRSDPAANAILAAPPSQVRAWFSEAVNPDTSGLVVIDPANHEVDQRDSHISPTDPTELIVNLQLLRPGAYIVVWRTQSLDDGHVTGGSFIFRIASADGSVPAVPATLPTSAIPGAAGYGAQPAAFDGPAAAQALFDFLALLFLTFWVGGVIWQTWIAPASDEGPARDGARLAAERFRRLAPWALGGLLLADVGFAAALTVETAGSLRGLIAPQFWRATILTGQFAAYWWMRQAVASAALLLTLLAPPHPPIPERVPSLPEGEKGPRGEATWTRELLATLRRVPSLPRRLWRGWLALSITGQIEVALGGLLLFAFAMSGHAAATPPSERAYAVTVDLAHLLFTAAWLGGLLYISAALVPAARGLSPRSRAEALARGVPGFSALAIVSAVFLALTGSLNATVRLTSISQLITTAYGRTLTIKVEIFLVMVAISAYHAFALRPRLARALAASDTAPRAVPVAAGVAITVAGTLPGARDAADAEGAGSAGDAADSGVPLSATARTLAARLEDWLRREALLGGGVLLCVALLAGFAGTLATPGGAQAAPVASSAFLQTQAISGYHVTLRVAPAAFGSNTFTVTVTNPQSKPATGAGVLVLMDNLDMDMGEQSLQLKPVGASQPGVYSGTGDLTMAGHWRVTVKVLPQGAKDYLTTGYDVLAGS